MIILQGLLTSKDSSRGRSHLALKGLQPISGTGVVMSGWRPLIKGYFGVALVVGAVMSSAFGAEN